jgi:hypothetical protein
MATLQRYDSTWMQRSADEFSELAWEVSGCRIRIETWMAPRTGKTARPGALWQGDMTALVQLSPFALFCDSLPFLCIHP